MNGTGDYKRPSSLYTFLPFRSENPIIQEVAPFSIPPIGLSQPPFWDHPQPFHYSEGRRVPAACYGLDAVDLAFGEAIINESPGSFRGVSFPPVIDPQRISDLNLLVLLRDHGYQANHFPVFRRSIPRSKIWFSSKGGGSFRKAIYFLALSSTGSSSETSEANDGSEANSIRSRISSSLNLLKTNLLEGIEILIIRPFIKFEGILPAKENPAMILELNQPIWEIATLRCVRMTGFIDIGWIYI